MPCFRHKHYYTHTKKKCKLFLKKIKKIFNPNYRNIYKSLKIKEKMRSWLLKFYYECILKKVLRPEVYKAGSRKTKDITNEFSRCISGSYLRDLIKYQKEYRTEIEKRRSADAFHDALVPLRKTEVNV